MRREAVPATPTATKGDRRCARVWSGGPERAKKTLVESEGERGGGGSGGRERRSDRDRERQADRQAGRQAGRQASFGEAGRHYGVH